MNSYKIKRALSDLRFATVKQISEYFQQKDLKRSFTFSSQYKKERLSERTIHSILKRLVAEGEAINKRGVYSMKDTYAADIRYFGNLFLKNAFSEMFFRKFTKQRTKIQNLNFLIKIFGSYLVFCFIEASRPIEVSSKSMSNHEKDKLSIRWLKQAIDPFSLYMFFLHVVYNQLEDDSVRKLNETGQNRRNVFKVYERILIPEPNSFYYGLAFSGGLGHRSKYNKKNLESRSGNPYFELNNKIIRELMGNFRKLSPYYIDLQRAKLSEGLVRPKEDSLRTESLRSKEIKKRHWSYFDLRNDLVEYWD